MKLDTFQAQVWAIREDRSNTIAHPNDAALLDHRHHAGPADDLTRIAADDHFAQQARSKRVDLRTRIPQAGQSQPRAALEPQYGAKWVFEQVQAGCGDVLTEGPWRDVEAFGIHLRQQF